MRKTLFGIVPRVLVLMLVAALAWSLATAKEDPANPAKRDNALAKTDGTPIARPLNINNWVTWMKATGQGNWTTTNHDGGFYPRGTSWAIYQDGIVYGGKPKLDAAYKTPAPGQDMRVSGQSYNVGTREGRIVGFGATATAANPADADVRIYRIRRDYMLMGSDELRRDAAEVSEITLGQVTQAQMDAIKAGYEKDWREWPVQIGAPFVERNGVAGYQAPPAGTLPDDLVAKKYDEPGIAGADPNSPADQVMWTVFNDLDKVASQGFVGSDPLGLEFQLTLWGYKRADALGQLYFKKYKIINKGGYFVDAANTQKGAYYIDSMYVCQWSDPDLGGSGDDLTGCDSTTSLGYIYNGNPIDSEFKKFGIPPPAAGYDFLAGPIVPSPGDVAVFDLKRRPGFKNLPMTSFAYFSAGSPISDPPFSYEGAKRWYRLLQGFVPDASTAPIRLFPHPPGVAQTKFPLSGDPVARKGFIDGAGTDYSYAPGDRRLLLNTGPFRMAPGDTQEVVIGVVAGLGSDRLSSVAVMKFNDEFVQNTYDALFAVPKAPPQPDVKIAELDEKVVFEWGSNPARTNEIENVVSQPGNYAFEGYNVYQLPDFGSPRRDWQRIATYDKDTDPAIILDRQFDVNTGLVLQVPIFYGSNSGVRRQFVLNRDYIKDVNKLYNGSTFYVAITAYSYSTTGFTPAALESAPIVYSVTPQSPKPGSSYPATYGDTLKGVVQLALPGGSLSEGLCIPIVVDPTKLTGHKYKITFQEDTTGTYWSVTDVTTNQVKLSRQANQTGDDNYVIVDGIMIKVTGPSTPGMKDWSIPAGERRFTWVNGVWGSEGFNGAIGNGYDQWFSSSTVTYDKLRNVLLKLAATDVNGNVTDPNDPDFSFGYRYLRGAQAAPAKPEFAPFIINKSGSFAFQEYKKNVPLAAYNVETNPPTRLMVGFNENNSAGGLVNGRYFPGFFNLPTDNIATSGPREWLYIFDVPYSETADPKLSVNILAETLPIMWFCTFNRRADVGFSAADEFLILANHLNTPLNYFEFTAPAAKVGDATLAKEGVGRIGVYPNPYYAFNPQESSRLVKFVTFTKLPNRATLRVFNVAGQLVRTLEKNDASQFLRWDLNNRDNFPVASGMYIIHVDMPDLGATKVLKLAVIQEQEVPDVF